MHTSSFFNSMRKSIFVIGLIRLEFNFVIFLLNCILMLIILMNHLNIIKRIQFKSIKNIKIIS